MRTSLVVIVPALLLTGLVVWTFSLRGFIAGDTACAPGACPLELHTDDSGKAFSYGATTRFTVFLNEKDNPSGGLRCIPDGIIGSVSNVPPAVPPMYAARFEGVRAGTCILTDDNFSATITIQ